MQSFKGRYCGQRLPPDLTTASGLMVLRVHTDMNPLMHMLPYFSANYITYSETAGKAFIIMYFESFIKPMHELYSGANYYQYSLYLFIVYEHQFLF